MTKDEITVLRLGIACHIGGLPLRYHSAYAVLGERAWHVLDGLKKQGAMEHPGYNRWQLTEKGRIAIALLNAKEPK